MANDRMKKLELTWAGKDSQIAVEPRILLEQPDKAYGDKDTENMLIHGDNLLALKSLEADFAGKVKCIYIDPPYNTGSAFEHYDDGYDHSIWLSLMRDRLEILWNLLASDGLLAIQIDDNEFARLYMLLIEICGEQNLKTICVKMSEATGVKMASVNKAGSIPKIKEFIILAKKNGVKGLKIEKIAKEKWDNEYKIYVENITQDEISKLKDIIENEDRTPDDVLMADEICKKFAFVGVENVIRRENVAAENKDAWLVDNSWRIVRTVATTDTAKEIADNKRNKVGEDKPSFIIETKQKKAYVIKNGYEQNTAQPRIKLLFADDYLTINPGDLWTDIKTTGLENEGSVEFKKGKKPEKLISRIIKMNSEKGDLVLDSFLGSGTTAAVAHKMGRRWIGIELGDHAYSHCIQRLQKVIDGTDQGGISKAVDWKGGGGFKFYELASSLIVKDARGFAVISKEYNGDMLAEAMCKIMGYKYRPDKAVFWKQGKGTEKNWLFTTTMTLTEDYLDEIHAELGDESLLVCCGGFTGNKNAFKNITIKKIPKAILEKCEWNKPGYPLPVKEDFTEKDFEIEAE